MPTKDELETRLYERMSQENKAFLTEMKAKSPDEIISHAYEIACRDNLLMLFEDETGLSERQLAVLNGTDDPRMEGLDFDSPAPSENAYMKRYSVANYAHRMRAGLAR